MITGTAGSTLRSSRHTSKPAASGKVTDRKSTRLNSSHTVISYAVHPALHSFPTRRSSDLKVRRHARHQLAQSQGLGHVVVGADLEGDDGVDLVRPRAHHDHGHGRVHLAKLAAHVEARGVGQGNRSEEHTSELQSHSDLVCRPPSSTLFPYTTLFRSEGAPPCAPPARAVAGAWSRSRRRRSRGRRRRRSRQTASSS